MQQTLAPHQQQSSRFTGASKGLVNHPGMGAPGMMAGRMMPGVGNMTGQSLTSGLEDLKKTAGVCAG